MKQIIFYITFIHVLLSATTKQYKQADFDQLKHKFNAEPLVIHYWDKQEKIGKWFKEFVTIEYEGDILWDATVLFGPEAIWGEIPESRMHYRRTILHKAEEIKSHIKQNITQ